jgi:muramoyltetrapeptide carboxypeptidase
MIKPPNLKEGDKVVLVAPARKAAHNDLKEGFRVLESWGLNVTTSEYLFSENHHYLSGSDEERLSDLQKAIDDQSVKAIFAVRGGYGSTRIIDDLDFSNLQNHPKWIIGFSDITAIHLSLLHHGIMSIHGTMPLLFRKNDAIESLRTLKSLLFTGDFSTKTSGINSNIEGTCRGRLIGGNLSLVVDSIGTASSPDTENAILVLEEIDEYYYRLDRMMTHLKRAGKLENLAGLIIGHMTDLKESELAFGETYQQIILDKVKEFQFPVAFNFPTGHENPNFAWIHGGMAELTVSAQQVSLRSTGLVL